MYTAIHAIPARCSAERWLSVTIGGASGEGVATRLVFRAGEDRRCCGVNIDRTDLATRRGKSGGRNSTMAAVANIGKIPIEKSAALKR